ncbi:MAG: hypothetical protein J6W00_01025 [Lentisphaeria bacterium]|nr:hypothetical protein [Lentisphaeria bacterium]
MRSHLSLLLPLTTLIVMIAGYCWGYKTMYLKREKAVKKAETIIADKTVKSADTDSISNNADIAVDQLKKHADSGESKLKNSEESSEEAGVSRILKRKREIFSTRHRKTKIRFRKTLQVSKMPPARHHGKINMDKHLHSKKNEDRTPPPFPRFPGKIVRSIHNRREMENRYRQKKYSGKKYSGFSKTRYSSGFHR